MKDHLSVMENALSKEPTSYTNSFQFNMEFMPVLAEEKIKAFEKEILIPICAVSLALMRAKSRTP